MHVKHTHAPKRPIQSPSCGENTMRTTTTKNTSTPMGTISGHSPHPPTCLWVGWVFCLPTHSVSISLSRYGQCGSHCHHGE